MDALHEAIECPAHELLGQADPAESDRARLGHDLIDPDHLAELDVYRGAARQLGIELVERPLRTEGEARAALTGIPKGEADGVLSPSCCYLNIPGFLLEIPPGKGLPTMFRQAFWVERGALASYGADYHTSGRQAARLVDKILKGTRPAELPVEVNHKIEFAINRRVAEALNVTIPPEILLRAGRIVGWTAERGAGDSLGFPLGILTGRGRIARQR